MECTNCRQEQERTEFLKSNGQLARMCATCRTKASAKFKAHYAKNAERVGARIKRWRTENADAYKASSRARKKRYLAAHPEARARKNARYRKKHPEKNNARVVAYKARKMQATPKWADLAAIDRIYALAAQQRQLTGESVHVDHIVPLKSDLVCGLHVEANLRLVIGSYNSRKRNHVWPDMPDKAAEGD